MPATSLVSSRLAARTGTRQLEVLARADAAADAVDRAIAAEWAALFRDLRGAASPGERRFIASMRLRKLLHAAHETLRDKLTGLVAFGHRTAAEVLVQTVPVEGLRYAAGARAGLVLAEAAPGQLPGFIQLSTAQPGRLATRDRSTPLREPARRKLSDAELRRRFDALLFEPPTAQQVQAILRQPVAGRSWEQDLTRASSLAGFDPERMATALAFGFAAGKNPRELAKDLLPAVQGVKSSARRIGRTYGMQVAHHAQMQAHAELGDLVDGYQIHALLDQWTRPAHRARNGTIYWRRPQPGQLGLDQMPHPPLEADGSMAWHCRCWLSPVLSPVPALVDHPEFVNARDKLIPDPAVYSDWFRQTTDYARKLAVGARRFATMRDVTGTAPEWEHFVEPETGDLLTLDQLRRESPVARAERVAKVRAIMGQRRRDLGQVAVYGFVP